MDPATMGALASGGLSMGQGSSLDAGGQSSMQGGDNRVGGTTFGNYTAAPKSNWLPWLVCGVVVLGGAYLLKGAK